MLGRIILLTTFVTQKAKFPLWLSALVASRICEVKKFRKSRTCLPRQGKTGFIYR